MKRFFTLLTVLAMTLSLVACGSSVPNSMGYDAETSTAESILETVGVAFAEPDGAENVAYAVLHADGYDIAQMSFTYEGRECVYRIAPGAPLSDDGHVPDASGVETEFAELCQMNVGRATAEIHYNENESGIINWYDFAPGVLYSLYVKGGETLDNFELAGLATLLYEPMQGEEPGDEEEKSASDPLADALTAISEECEPGASGNSLTAAKCAAELMDVFTEEDYREGTLKAVVNDFLSGLDEDAAADFAEQFADVADAAEELCSDDGESLLEDCGYESDNFPWDWDAMETNFDIITDLCK